MKGIEDSKLPEGLRIRQAYPACEKVVEKVVQIHGDARNGFAYRYPPVKI
jgi:hypothetical protein